MYNEMRKRVSINQVIFCRITWSEEGRNIHESNESARPDEENQA